VRCAEHGSKRLPCPGQSHTPASRCCSSASPLPG
jgi:hypothetical protein